MKAILLSVIDKVFDMIPFSKKEEMLKKELSDELILKYETALDESNEVSSAIQLMAECEDIKTICVMTGHKEEDVLKCMDMEGIKNKADTKRILNKARRCIYLQCLFIAIIFEYVLTIILQFSPRVLLMYGIASIISAGFLLLVTRIKRSYLLQCDYENLRFDKSARQVFYDLNDRYSKKFLNLSMLNVGIAAYIIFSILLSVLSLQYLAKDVHQQILYISFILEVLVYLSFKNYLCKRLSDVFFVPEHVSKYNCQCIRVLLISASYFAVVMTVLLIFANKMNSINNWFFLLVLLYLLLCGVYDCTLRKRIVFRNITMNIRRIVLISALFLSILTYNAMSMNLYMTQPYINTVTKVMEQEDQIAYNEDNGVYTITTKKDDFKILQLTDIHLGGSIMSVAKDVKALQACDALINKTKPDMVVVTGDLVFPMGVMSFSLSNDAPIMQFANYMRNKGIPWTFTYGNHDTEAMATLDKMEFDSLMRSLSFKSSGNLLYPYIQPDIYGRSNQMIEIRDTEDSLKQALFLMDSNDYIEGAGTSNEYDYIHDDQVAWYKKNVLALSDKEGYTIPSMVFFHMPLQEYKTANDLYEAESEQVEYFYGKIGETMIDRICSSKYKSKLFDTAVELGSTRAMFCGHDHYNNQSLEYKGIRLTYGYSIDYLVMPGIDKDTDQRGATLITVNHDKQFEINPVRLIDIE